MHPKSEFSASYSHFWVTSGEITSLPGNFRSCDIISGHVTTTSCMLQPCGSIKTRVFRLLQPLPGDFRKMTSLPDRFRRGEVM